VTAKLGAAVLRITRVSIYSSDRRLAVFDVIITNIKGGDAPGPPICGPHAQLSSKQAQHAQP
jgi:hypothetical protein